MRPLAPQPRSCSSPAASYPQWMLLAPHSEWNWNDSSIDTRTLAAARTSSGQSICVFLRRAVAPAVSRICVRHIYRHAVGPTYATVVAAHGDSVLIATSGDHFIYNAGADVDGHPARPPSLFLLPPNRLNWLDANLTGLLRRGDDELVVAALNKVKVSGDDDDDARTPKKKAAELVLFRSGECSVERPRIILDGDDDTSLQRDALLSSWVTNAVVPVGGRHLCWIDLSLGVLLSDVFDDSPVLRHVRFPVEAAPPHPDRTSWRVCVTARGAVKLVNIFPRRCSSCGCSEHACTVNTWTLKAQDMAWVMDTVVDTTELWALDKYDGIARVQLVCPVVRDSSVVHDESAAQTEDGEDHNHKAPKGRKRRQVELARPRRSKKAKKRSSLRV